MGEKGRGSIRHIAPHLDDKESRHDRRERE